MKCVRVRRAVLGAVVAAAGALGVAQAGLQPLATVKIAKTPESITVRQLRARADLYEKQLGKKLSVSERKELLDSLIDEKLVLQAAQKAGMSLTDAEVNKYFLDNISRQVGKAVTETEFASIVRQETGKSLDEYMREQVGMTTAEYKSNIKTQLLCQRFIMQEKREELQQVQPTDAEIRDYYALNQSKLVRPETLKLFLVVAPKGNDPAAARKRLTDVYGEVKGKADYDAIARRYAKDDALNAGNVFVSRTQEAAQQLRMSMEQIGKLFSQAPGTLSEITETQSDFQFFVIRERLEVKLLGLSDIIQPDSTVTVYDYIRDGLTQEKQGALLAAAIKDVTAKLRTPQNFTMLKTGDALDKLLSW